MNKQYIYHSTEHSWKCYPQNRPQWPQARQRLPIGTATTLMSLSRIWSMIKLLMSWGKMVRTQKITDLLQESCFQSSPHTTEQEIQFTTIDVRVKPSVPQRPHNENLMQEQYIIHIVHSLALRKWTKCGHNIDNAARNWDSAAHNWDSAARNWDSTYNVRKSP